MKTEEAFLAIFGNDVIYQEFIEARFLKFRPKFSTDFAILYQKNMKIQEVARIGRFFEIMSFLGIICEPFWDWIMKRVINKMIKYC